MRDFLMLLPLLVSLLAVLACGASNVSLPPLPQDKSTPFQQRLASYGPNAVSVGWNTYAAQNHSCVQYGRSPNSLGSRACSNHSSTYETSRTFSHSVILNGLSPATYYYYKIVSTNSSIESFFSPRAAGDLTPFKFDVVIDLGVYGANGFTVTSSGAKPSEKNKDTKRDQEAPLTVDPDLNHSTISRLAANFHESEFVLHPGDFGYADEWHMRPQNKQDGKGAYQAILEQFYDQLAPISGRKAYMAGPGNHEARCTTDSKDIGRCPAGQNNFTDYLHRFDRTMPAAFPSRSLNHTAQKLAEKARSLANPPFWYSFEHGMAHIVMMDTETDIPHAPDDGGAIKGFGKNRNQQQNFLEADLASVDRTVTPWILAAGHRPWYTTGGQPCDACRTYFEDILYRYGVDLGIFGHRHNSQRFLPVYRDKADPRGMHDPEAPMYIVAGGAGNIEGLHYVGSKPSFNAFAYADDFAYSTVHIRDRHHLQVDFIRSATGEVLDSSTLYKSHNKASVVQHPGHGSHRDWAHRPVLDQTLAWVLGVFLVCLPWYMF